MLHTVLNKSYKQHPTKQQLYGHLSSKQDMLEKYGQTHKWHYPIHGYTSVDQPAKI